jgi:energy-coupling factor transport system ATP-binding protein
LTGSEDIKTALTLTGVTFSYPRANALAGIDLTVPAGSYCGIVGPNGSGKTTLAFLIAGILRPTDGTLDTHGLRVGLVLSNPANQIVSLVVEEDIAFGPENMGLSGPEINARIDGALKAIHSGHLRKALTSTLSGGQLAKIAYAGQLAMDVDILVLDEGTVMLDPDSRSALLAQIRELNEGLNKTVVHITHRLEDLMASDMVLVMEGGVIRLTATSAIDLADRLSREESPGIEAGPELRYRCLLRARGIDDGDLRQATAELAEHIRAAKT